MSIVYMPDVDTAAAGSMLPQRWQIESRRQNTEDTFTLTLAPCRDATPMVFRPGQFNMLYVFGTGEVPISISGPASMPDTLVHTVRVVGPVTAAMSRLKAGSILGVRGPFGTSWPVEEARGRDVVIIAGGIGLPPLRPAIYHILDNRLDYGKVTLLYGARTPGDLLYVQELEEWRARLDFDVLVTVDAGDETWRGNVGVVTTLLPGAHFEPAAATAMIVGPEIMMRFAIIALSELGMRDEDIYVSMERNMKCGLGFCGHCQLGPYFVCKDGPVFPYNALSRLLQTREV